MKLSGKTWLKMILKVTENYFFTVSPSNVFISVLTRVSEL